MLCTVDLQFCLMAVGEFDKNVFETRSERTDFRDGDAAIRKRAAKVVEIKMIVDERMNRLTKDCRAANAGEFANGAKSASDFRSGDFDSQSSCRLDFGKFAKRIGRAIGDKLSVVNVSDVAAAFGFIHVMSCDEKCDAVA